MDISGNPACNANLEITEGRKIEILKPEYLTLNSQGNIINISNSLCNSDTLGNSTIIINNSNSQFITISETDKNYLIELSEPTEIYAVQ